MSVTEHGLLKGSHMHCTQSGGRMRSDLKVAHNTALKPMSARRWRCAINLPQNSSQSLAIVDWQKEIERERGRGKVKERDVFVSASLATAARLHLLPFPCSRTQHMSVGFDC